MSIQPLLFELEPVPAPGPQPAPRTPKERGAVFTRQSVVDFMLDLVGYTADRPLWTVRLLEPSAGDGRFVLSAISRLLAAWQAGPNADDDSVLDSAIRAVELDPATCRDLRSHVASVLRDGGVPELSARRLARTWVRNQDFLLGDIVGPFDAVVGNPPYIRQELIPNATLARYRDCYPTMVGRADVYVPFFERSLSLLTPGGKLCFICADAWTKNDYGRALRRLVASRFALRAYVDMYGTDAFEEDVGAYTSITVIERGQAGPVRSVRAESTEPAYLAGLRMALTSSSAGTSTVATVAAPARGGGPWLLKADRRLSTVRLLEDAAPALEQTGCHVGIGVATGADKVFVAPFAALDVEDSRKLPLATNQDVVEGRVTWSGLGVVNPWSDDGGLVSLAEFPRLAAYLEPFRECLARRHTARRDPARSWYRTIDRITPELTRRPKLLIPDIRVNGNAIAYEPGELYPHHNLYYVTAMSWDLRALQAVLRSGIAKLFIDAYAVRIGGGYLRFQAQYLRRIHVPAWAGIPPELRSELIAAGTAGQLLPTETLERVYRVPAGSLSALDEESQR
ncbi:MAG: Eco57I restriction-modification methylase domain-containing protein [Bifidobacteriaceae bacterium]|jgi:hypothetical protein|nr:Eco57I restriction-modification methylase domain-containing protein [Bifidobacteriaceae bacterium]